MANAPEYLFITSTLHSDWNLSFNPRLSQDPDEIGSCIDELQEKVKI